MRYCLVHILSGKVCIELCYNGCLENCTIQRLETSHAADLTIVNLIYKKIYISFHEFVWVTNLRRQSFIKKVFSSNEINSDLYNPLFRKRPILSGYMTPKWRLSDIDATSLHRIDFSSTSLRRNGPARYWISFTHRCIVHISNFSEVARVTSARGKSLTWVTGFEILKVNRTNEELDQSTQMRRLSWFLLQWI